MQTVIWTVLPNGSSGGTRKLSVLVSPRLQGGTSLDSFPDFRDWWAKELGFTLRFEPLGAGPAATATVAAPPAPESRQALWTALFSGQTTVKSFGFSDYSKIKTINSYPITKILSDLQGKYQDVAASPATATQLPPADSFLGPADGLQHIAFGYFVGQTTDSRLSLDPKLAKEFSPQPKANAEIARHFWPLRDFLRPRNPLQDVEVPAPGVKAKQYSTQEYQKVFPLDSALLTPKPDFHQALALLGSHPELMRVLGLVIDLEVDENELTAGGNQPISGGLVSVDQVTGDWQLAPTHARPKTRFADGFVAAPSTPELGGGLLNLGLPEYSLVEVDVEGAALKLMGLADTIVRSKAAKKTADTPTAFTLPALRSGGISIVRAEHAKKLAGQLAKSATLNANIEKKGAQGQPAPVQSQLSAEDLVRGYRVDVEDLDDPAGGWHPLCGRRGHYSFHKTGQLRWPPADELEAEGFASLAVTAPPDKDSPDAPNPLGASNPELFLTESIVRWNGWSLSARRPGDHIGTDDAQASFDEAQTETEFGLSIELRPPTGTANKLPRLRFGHTYRLRARAVDLAGNSLPLSAEGPADGASDPLKYTRFEPVVPPTLLLREQVGDGESIARIVIRSRNFEPAQDTVATTDTRDRHLAPPVASQLLAEQHGMFDAMAPADSYALVSAREGTHANPADRHDADFPHPEPSVALPYLPDPLAAGAAFLGLPGIGASAFTGLPAAPPNKETRYLADGSVKVTDLSASEKPPITLIEVDFDAKAWPDARPFRLHVVEGGEPPSFDSPSRELKVGLPKAETAHVRMSSYLDAEALSLLGIWKWLEEKTPALTAKQKQRLQQLTLQGRHWLLTPFREVVLVHAVQQPIGTLDLSKLSVTREFGRSFATLHDALEVHTQSTGKIDVNAGWTENVDLLGEPGPTQLTGQAHAFNINVPYPGLPHKPSDDVVTIDHRHEFHDTKHRWVKYTAVATTRYREYFTGEIEKGGFEITRSSPPIPALDIPSSARPEVPRLLYVVPMFTWDRPKPTKDGATSTRSAGGLRVYLERPWYSSGNDELLGVVIPDGRVKQTTGPDDDSVKPYLTHWGADPIAASDLPHANLALTDFPRRTDTSRGRLTIDERDAYVVAVAGHEVEYDPVRRLWFSDIVIDPGSAYSPFVRLALARFQPHSVEAGGRGGAPLKNVHLSRVVLADFMQLLPARIASVGFGSPLVVSLKGVGVHRNEVTVRVEAQQPDLLTDLGWRPLPGTAVQPVTPAKPDPLLRRWMVTLPPGRLASPRRLVIREHELIPTDRDGKVQGRRLVYAETFNL
jgi:hypothetical protein